MKDSNALYLFIRMFTQTMEFFLFIHLDLFNDAVSSSGYITLSDSVICE
jgi:hypothetical protein